jgi:hypothetical protein
MDLCRRILLALEAHPDATGANTVPLDLNDRDPLEVNYHLRLLKSGGLIEVDLGRGADGDVCVPRCLTWAGHEFIEAARKDTFWQQAKTMALDKTGGLSLDVLKAIIVKLATDGVFGGGP